MRPFCAFVLLSACAHGALFWGVRALKPRNFFKSGSEAFTVLPLSEFSHEEGKHSQPTKGKRSTKTGVRGAPKLELEDLLQGENLAPEYPAEALRRGWQGVVEIYVAFAPNGLTREVAIARSSGYPSLDEAALGAARAWKRPANLDIQELRVPFEFELLH